MASPRLYVWIGNGSGVRQFRRIATADDLNKSHAFGWNAPRVCGERSREQYFVVRRGGLLILVHISVGDSPYVSAGMGVGVGVGVGVGMGMGMGMVDWGGFSLFLPSAIQNTSVIHTDEVITA